MLVKDRVQQGPEVHITGNVITLLKELGDNNAYWKEKIAVQHTRKDKKFDQIYKKIQSLTRNVATKKKFFSH